MTNVKKSHTILMFAQNKRGVLERITMIIRRKMYNLEQITASDTERKGIKRLTITFSHEEGAKIPQIIKQLNKIVEVIEVKDVTNKEVIKREVGIIKIKKTADMSILETLTNKYDVQTLQNNQDYTILQVVGDSHDIISFRDSLEPYGILEFGSSGSVAMEK